ncbi:hypothetical protein [Granulicella aggregans]|nr:hypothetical protein [Granulicella aggregans]
MTEQSGWIETTATVVSCRYQFARMNTFRMGVQSGEKYRIAFDYVAHGQTYSDEFQSAVAIPQNEQFSICYNPLAPQQNDRSSEGASAGRAPVFALGVAGSIVLSLLWLAVLRGCS